MNTWYQVILEYDLSCLMCRVCSQLPKWDPFRWPWHRRREYQFQRLH